jgi:hypothetical protein
MRLHWKFYNSLNCNFPKEILLVTLVGCKWDGCKSESGCTPCYEFLVWKVKRIHWYIFVFIYFITVNSVISFWAESNITRFKSGDISETYSVSVIKTPDDGNSVGLWKISSFEPADVSVGSRKILLSSCTMMGSRSIHLDCCRDTCLFQLSVLLYYA